MSCITHVVVIVQENRSFNDIFDGFPGAKYADSGTYVDDNGVRHTVNPLHDYTFGQEGNFDPAHFYKNYLDDDDGGQMDGFNSSAEYASAPDDYVYAHLDKTSVPEYWAMASNYTLADNFFPTQGGASFAAHLNLISTNTILASQFPDAEVNIPTKLNTAWGCDSVTDTATFLLTPARSVTSPASGPFPCFSSTDIKTLADVLDNHQVSWAYFAPKVGASNPGQIWTIFDAIDEVRYGPEWNNNVDSPPNKVILDANTMGDNFPNVAWVIPTSNNSHHAQNCDTGSMNDCICSGGNPICTSDHGPSWVSAVVNAIGNDTALWKHTAIIVVWDDWGGWFDPVAPPQPDFRGLGIRVPCIIISPYSRRGVVSHTQYEFGSIARFIEQVFGKNGNALGPIGYASAGYTDRQHMNVATGASITVNSLSDAFDFTQQPAVFQPINATYPASLFINEDENAAAAAPDND